MCLLRSNLLILLLATGFAAPFASGQDYGRIIESTVGVWGAGINNSGIESLPAGFTSISCGKDHLLALNKNGKVLAWGGNRSGQCDIPESLAKVSVKAIGCGNSYSLVLSQKGEVMGWGDNSFGQLIIPLVKSPVKQIAAGSFHCLALLEDGHVVGWGSNYHKEAKVPSFVDNIVSIAAGGNHSLALNSSGQVMGWGENIAGQIKSPANLPPLKAIAAGGSHSMGLTTNGRVVAWGDNRFGQASVPMGLTDIIQIAAGEFHSMALRSDGTIVVWGKGSVGQLEVPKTIIRASFIGAGSNYCAALAQQSRISSPTRRDVFLKNTGLFEARGEFETTADYEKRKLEQQRIVRAEVQSSITQETVDIDSLGSYNADQQQFRIVVAGKSYFVHVPLADAPSLRKNQNAAKVIQTRLLEEDLLSERTVNLALVHPISKTTYPFGNQVDLSKYGGQTNPVQLPAPLIVANAGATQQNAEQQLPSTLEALGLSDNRVPRYYALVIGISKYANSGPGLPNLDHPAEDAAALTRLLTTRYMFDSSRVSMLINATRKDIIRHLEILSTELTNRDNLLVFYAGHGFYDKSKDFGYWLPSDAELSDRSGWISNGTIKDYIGATHSKHTLLIADACFSGSIFKSRKVDAPSVIMKFNEIYKDPSRRAITSGNFTTVPDKSVFLEQLLKRLDENMDVFLPSQSLFARIFEPVTNNSTNTPQFGVIQGAGDEGGDFIFIRR